MARTVGPLLSQEASGTIAGLLTFGKTMGRGFVKRKPIARPQPGSIQQLIKENVAFLGPEWSTQLIGPEKDLWAAIERGEQSTPYNTFIGDAGRRLATGQGPRKVPQGGGSTPPIDGLVDPVAIGGTKVAIIEWQWFDPEDSWNILFFVGAQSGLWPPGTGFPKVVRADDSVLHRVELPLPVAGLYDVVALVGTTDGTLAAAYTAIGIVVT